MTYDIGTDIVEETRVVRDDHTGDIGEVAEVLLQPSNSLNIQVIGRLIQQQDIGTDQHGPSQFQLHLPTSRKRGDGVGLLLLGETDGEQHGGNLGDWPVGESDIGSDKVDDRDGGVFTLESVLNHKTSEDILSWESLDLIR